MTSARRRRGGAGIRTVGHTTCALSYNPLSTPQSADREDDRKGRGDDERPEYEDKEHGAVGCLLERAADSEDHVAHAGQRAKEAAEQHDDVTRFSVAERERPVQP